MNWPDGLDPLRRRRLDGELLKNSASGVHRHHPHRGFVLQETGPQCGEGLEPLPRASPSLTATGG